MKQITENSYMEYFSSLYDFSQKLKERKTNKAFEKVYGENLPSMSETDSGIKFTGTKSYKNADDMLLNGDSESLGKIEEFQIRNENISTGFSKKPVGVRSMCGSSPIVPLYISGCPKNMYCTRKMPAKSKVLTIVVNVTYCAFRKSKEIINIGANFASAISSLEKCGYRINLFVAEMFTSSSCGYRIISLIKLKDAGAPLDKLSIAYPLINPSFLRRQSFRFIETIDIPEKIAKDFTRNYGGIYDIESRHISSFPGIEDARIINCDTMIGKGYTSKESISDLMLGKYIMPS